MTKNILIYMCKETNPFLLFYISSKFFQLSRIPLYFSLSKQGAGTLLWP